MNFETGSYYRLSFRSNTHNLGAASKFDICICFPFELDTEMLKDINSEFSTGMNCLMHIMSNAKKSDVRDTLNWGLKRINDLFTDRNKGFDIDSVKIYIDECE